MRRAGVALANENAGQGGRFVVFENLAGCSERSKRVQDVSFVIFVDTASRTSSAAHGVRAAFPRAIFSQSDRRGIRCHSSACMSQRQERCNAVFADTSASFGGVGAAIWS